MFYNLLFHSFELEKNLKKNKIKNLSRSQGLPIFFISIERNMFLLRIKHIFI